MYRFGKNRKSKGIFKAAIIIAVLYISYDYFFIGKAAGDFSKADNKKIYLDINGAVFENRTSVETVDDFLKEKDLEITENDSVYPEKETKLYYGSRVYVKKAKKISVTESGNTREVYTLADFLGQAVKEKTDLNFGEYDIMEPSEETLVKDGLNVVITHVKVERETEDESIAYKTTTNKDDNMGWREKKVTQKGEKGMKEVVYEVVYHDGEEIKRKKLEENITKEPVTEIVTQGTFVKLGKTHTGLGTWYGQPKYLETRYPSVTGFYAANPWLPMGSYIKVTNKENGKSVIARVNDRGPFGPNRIIDLGRSAFSQISSIGAGVIDVKVEEIKN